MLERPGFFTVNTREYKIKVFLLSFSKFIFTISVTLGLDFCTSGEHDKAIGFIVIALNETNVIPIMLLTAVVFSFGLQPKSHRAIID